MVGLAVAMTVLFAQTLHRQTSADGRTLAEAFVTQGVQNAMGADTELWSHPIADTSPIVRELDEVTRANGAMILDRMTLYTPEGVPIYNSRGTVADAKPANSELLREALGSLTPVSEQTSSELGSALVVYVPVTYGDRYGGVYGIAAIEIPWDDTQSFIQNSVIKMAAIIVVILLLAWLLLFRTVHRASQRLRDQAEENERLALHDALTGLPNRRLLSDRLDRAVASAQRSSKNVALMVLDVDRFKEVNDTLGHDYGDNLLVHVAQRIEEVLRDADTVARLGGDEFAVLAPNVGSIADAERLARRIHGVFDQPFVVGELVLHVDSSLGVALLPAHAEDGTELMQRADTAMYAAKSSHVGVFLYDPTSDGYSTERLLLLGDLRKALGTSQLFIHYQPKVDLSTNQVVGLEALLRWEHPTRGNIPPNEFIPLAESTGLIYGLTRYVLELVLTQMAEWDAFDDRFSGLSVAVNLSARNLLEPSFAEYVEDMLASHQVDSARLELEVTESALIEDPVRSHEMLHKLAALGITLAIDDFGTGYTSMAQLEAMPLTTLKIDRSFVVRMADDPGGATLVKAMVDLAHEFGLDVVAEGVEDEEVTERLRDLGCDIGQGFLWSRPVHRDELPEVLFQLSFRRAQAQTPVS